MDSILPCSLLQIQSIIYKGSLFLENYAKTPEGYYPQAINIGLGGEVAPSTANCIEALYFSSSLNDEKISKYTNELFCLQQFGKKNKYAWCTNEGISVWATAKSIISLLNIIPGLINDQRITNSISWLIKQKNPSGCYGFARSYPSRPFYTYYVLEVMALAFNLSKNKTIYLSEIESISSGLEKIKISDGVWSNGSSSIPCAANTLMGLSSLVLSENILNKETLSDDCKIASKEFVRNKLYDENNWAKLQWSEPGRAFDLQFFPPESIKNIISIFGKEDDLTAKMISWIITNKIDHFGTYGWRWPTTETKNIVPYTWTTAVAIKSLCYYLKAENLVAKKRRFLLYFYKTKLIFHKPIAWKKSFSTNTVTNIITLSAIAVTLITTAIAIFLSLK